MGMVALLADVDAEGVARCDRLPRTQIDVVRADEVPVAVQGEGNALGIVCRERDPVNAIVGLEANVELVPRCDGGVVRFGLQEMHVRNRARRMMRTMDRDRAGVLAGAGAVPTIRGAQLEMGAVVPDVVAEVFVGIQRGLTRDRADRDLWRVGFGLGAFGGGSGSGRGSEQGGGKQQREREQTGDSGKASVHDPPPPR